MLLKFWPNIDLTEFSHYIWAILPYAIMWVIWCLRNDAIFNNADFLCEKVVITIKATIWSWLEISKDSLHCRAGHAFNELRTEWATMF
ncbi:hypothetical protein FRX31_006745, partial [Thalictrum thalictroides]